MITEYQRDRIEKYFPELGFDTFITKYGVPDHNIEDLTPDECKVLDQRIISVAEEISIFMAFEEETAAKLQKIIDTKMAEVTYKTAKGEEISYKSINNKKEDKVFIGTDATRKSFATYLISEMLNDNVLVDPHHNKTRASVLKNLWFGIVQIGNRIDNWSRSDRTNSKRNSYG